LFAPKDVGDNRRSLVIRVIACLFILMTIVAAAPGGTASQAVDCQEVSAYFGRVDEAIVGGMAELIERPGFEEDFEQASQKSAENDAGFLALSPGERKVVIGMLSVPGDALVPMEEDEIPDAVRDLHDSAAKMWVLMPEMMRAISDDGPSAGLIHAGKMESAANDNLLAQETLTAACPGEVDAYAAKAGSTNASGDVFGNDLFTFWGDVASKDMEGIGYEILFFATEEEVIDAAPGAIAPPASGSRSGWSRP
jgi:hypothetical protein